MLKRSTLLAALLFFSCTGGDSAADLRRDLLIKYVDWEAEYYKGDNVQVYETATDSSRWLDEDSWSYKPTNSHADPRYMPEGYAFSGVQIDHESDETIMSFVRTAVPDYNKLSSFDYTYNHRTLAVVDRLDVMAPVPGSGSSYRKVFAFLTLHSVRDSSLNIVDSVGPDYGNKSLLLGDAYFELQGEYYYYHKRDYSFRFHVPERRVEQLPYGPSAVMVPHNRDDVIIYCYEESSFHLLNRNLEERLSFQADLPGRPKTCWAIGDDMFVVGFLYNKGIHIPLWVMDVMLLDFEAGSATKLFECKPAEILDVEVVE